jgi:hypothetical protein
MQFAGAIDRLQPVAHAQFPIDILEMCLDGIL